MRFPCSKAIEIRAPSQGADDGKRKVVYPVGYFDDSVIFVCLFPESEDNTLDEIFDCRTEKIKSAGVERRLQCPSKKVMSCLIPGMSSTNCASTSY